MSVKRAHKKTKTSNKNLSAIGIMVFLAWIHASTPGAYAVSNEKNRLLEVLEDIKNQQASLKDQNNNLEIQATSLLLDLGENKALIENSKANISKLQEAITEAETILHEKKLRQGELLSFLYIEESGNKPFFALLKSSSLSDLIQTQVYIRNTRDQLITSIKTTQQEAEQLAGAKQAAITQREVLAAQIDILENQIGSLKTAMIDTESKIKDLEKTSKDVEKQIISLDVPVTLQNNREFTEWNIIDFNGQDSMVIYGAGTPHGLGMSQYGAKAMADRGKNYEDILTHYYQGTHLESIDTADISIRVKLSASTQGGKIIVTDGPAKLIKDGNSSELPPGSIVTTEPGILVESASQNTRLVVTHKFDRFNTYRGSIKIVGSPGNINTINILPIEEYLKGVVPGEVSASWAKEALKAQAVAARNYGYKNRGAHSEYDLCDTPACQVYLGTLHEHPNTNQAIEETKGRILKYQGEIVTAYYFSSSGGWTENNENVWGGKPIPWLRGVESPGEQSPYNSWQTISFSKTALQQYLNSDEDTRVGNLDRIEIIKRGVSGRVLAVKITGSEGEKTVTGKTFKYVVNINIPDGTKDYIKNDLFGIK